MSRFVARLRGRPAKKSREGKGQSDSVRSAAGNSPRARGTFVRKHNAAWLEREVGAQMPLKIYVWRTFGVKFLRTFIHPRLAGELWLRLLYGLEERFPGFLGRNGQYPLIVIGGIDHLRKE
jgi:hypothetical protein